MPKAHGDDDGADWPYLEGQPANEKTPVATLEDLQKINPVQIARDIYRNRYGEDMPDEVARLLAQAKRSCEEQQTTQP